MLYYSHVNEDNRVERSLLAASGCHAIVAVAGSGERVIALLDDEKCSQVHAVDVNEEALFLLQLKLAALKALDVDDYLQFCGYSGCSEHKRKAWYVSLEREVEPACKTYWDRNISVIERGIVHAGHFETFLKKIRPLLSVVLGKGFHSAFRGVPAASTGFPETRWRLLSRLFSLRWVYKLMGNRDAAFVSKDAAIGHIPSALNKIIYNGEAASCFMAHLIFNGSLQEMKEIDLPPSLQKRVLTRIKERLNASTLAIHYHHTDILAFAAATGIQGPVFYSLSDVMSFESVDYLRQLISKTASPGNTVVWRTFLRNRGKGDAVFHNEPFNVEEHSHRESTGMYEVFSLKMAHA